MPRPAHSLLVALLALLVLAVPALAASASGVGTVRVLHHDDLAHGTSSYDYALATASGTVPLGWHGAGGAQLAGARVRVDRSDAVHLLSAPLAHAPTGVGTQR